MQYLKITVNIAHRSLSLVMVHTQYFLKVAKEMQYSTLERVMKVKGESLKTFYHVWTCE